jgi:hypothetical protein
MIIDIHTHLGDILNANGGQLIDQKNVRKKIFFDMISFSERLLHNALSDAFDRWLYHKVYHLVTRSSIARNATASLEHMRRSMDEAGITKTACMPIPPFLTFEDLRRAKEKDVGNRLPAVKIVKKACQRDKALEKRVFYENAVSLVGVDE